MALADSQSSASPCRQAWGPFSGWCIKLVKNCVPSLHGRVVREPIWQGVRKYQESGSRSSRASPPCAVQLNLRMLKVVYS